ncbi:alpha-amylase family glycosyl hydrolase [Reinekea sp. G2M2-21]|uniref:alpha-amylase family glycosyl hydrolase n=1 Tax=Reinekea sp. G2M2-21 TaxID=2788942 RepID=UPI0018A9E864|nr:alpha-amylase family glycosyl hydrolase [Reinekea sp. G2M2-21]
MKRISIFIFTLAGFTSIASADWYFRGTPNGWNTTPLTTEDNINYCTTQTFANGDNNGGPRFKVDRFANWSENYPAQDYLVSANKTFDICFNTQQKSFSVNETVTNSLSIQRLGAEYDAQGTTFAIWSPETANVVLNLDGVDYPMPRIQDQLGYSQVYAVRVDGDLHRKPYYFKVGGIQVRDPYGKMAVPNEDINLVMDMNRSDPVGGWADRPTLVEREDAIIYEIHVRDFTIDASSGVSAEKRGKFLGMVEAGTRYQTVATGIDHLKELGVTHVQILPFYDFASCPDVNDTSCYNWGYDPRNYNVPEERYSISQDYDKRARELKTMVNEFHKAGIRVVMDVVYNHTYDFEMFEAISNQYYTDLDLSGTGNSIDANVPMVGRMIQDSLEYWLEEYNLDGFRFDLVGIFDHDEFGDWGRHLNATYPDRNLLIYGEPWNGYASDPRDAQRVRLGTIAREADAHVGVFNPKYREAIKGANDSGSGGGFAFNQGQIWQMDFGSRASIRYSNSPWQVIDQWDPMFATDPEQSINYVSAHDNLSLRDKILEWADLNGISHNSGYLRRIHNYANGMILTAQGIPFLHGGVELMRDKQGDHNSYRSSDEVNKIRWQWKLDNADVFNYYKELIELRKNHPGFRMNTWDEINQNVTTIRYANDVLVTDINAAANGDSWNRILVIYASGGNFNYPLPSGNWKVAVEQNNPAAGNGRTVSGSIGVEGTAVTILYQD